MQHNVCMSDILLGLLPCPFSLLWSTFRQIHLLTFPVPQNRKVSINTGKCWLSLSTDRLFESQFAITARELLWYLTLIVALVRLLSLLPCRSLRRVMSFGHWNLIGAPPSNVFIKCICFFRFVVLPLCHEWLGFGFLWHFFLAGCTLLAWLLAVVFNLSFWNCSTST